MNYFFAIVLGLLTAFLLYKYLKERKNKQTQTWDEQIELIDSPNEKPLLWAFVASAIFFAFVVFRLF